MGAVDQGVGANATAMKQAMGLMVEALDVLDSCDAPAQIGAHLDLAIERLREAMPACISTPGEFGNA